MLLLLLCCDTSDLFHCPSFQQGEKRLEEIGRLTSATAKLITMFEDPWEELTFRNVGNQGRIFNAVEDRFLLCLTHLHGYVMVIVISLVSFQFWNSNYAFLNSFSWIFF